MTTPAKKNTKKQSAQKDLMTETSIKVGKALARTSIKAEKSTRKVKKMAEELLDNVTGKHPKKTSARATSIPLAPASGLSVEGHLGFLAGDIYQILNSKGETAATELVGTLKKRTHSEAIIYAAIGWLAREGQITFSPDGKMLMLR